MLIIDLKSRIPIYEQIKNQLTELIRIGYYKADDQLPSIRSVAADAGLNVNTVKRAFLDLESDGVIYTVAGRGSFVSENALAGKQLRAKALSQIKETVAAAKTKGIEKEEIMSVVNDVFKEDGQ